MPTQRNYGVNQQLERIANAILASHAASTAAQLDAMWGAILNGENTSLVFPKWWKLARELDDNTSNRYAILARFFEMLADAWGDKVYTLRGPDYRVNTTGVTTLTPLADLADKTAAGVYTETDNPSWHWTDDDPMLWYVRANALSLSDGTMNILAVEGVDDAFDISGYTAPVYTFSLALWRAWYTDGAYEYKTWATKQKGGMKPLACDVAPDGTHRPMTWHATFGGSLITKDNKTCLTSGAGNTLAINVAAATGLTYARNTGTYEGTYSDTDLDHLLDMWQLRHFDLENSGILEGCLNYNYDYTVAVAEENVRRVLLTTAQGANLVLGSTLDVGSSARNGSIARGIITRIETVNVGGTDYAAVYIDVNADFTTAADSHAATLPWVPGSTERLPGHKDGSLYNCTNGKTPARINGVEVIDGAYAVGLDPLWVSDWDAERTPKSIYTVYQCRNSENQASAVTNYEQVGTFTGPNSGWQYYKHMQIRNDGMMIPEGAGEANTGSSKWMKSAFYFYGSSGVRAPGRFCALNRTGGGGLAGADGGNSPSYAGWYERPRLSGSGKKRGEWAAA